MSRIEIRRVVSFWASCKPAVADTISLTDVDDHMALRWQPNRCHWLNCSFHVAMLSRLASLEYVIALWRVLIYCDGRTLGVAIATKGSVVRMNLYVNTQLLFTGIISRSIEIHLSRILGWDAYPSWILLRFSCDTIRLPMSRRSCIVATNLHPPMPKGKYWSHPPGFISYGGGNPATRASRTWRVIFLSVFSSESWNETIDIETYVMCRYSLLLVF